MLFRTNDWRPLWALSSLSIKRSVFINPNLRYRKMFFQQTQTPIELPQVPGVGQVVREQVRRLAATVLRIADRQRQRYALADLDERLLSDIGVSGEAARAEAAKPFWRP